MCSFCRHQERNAELHLLLYLIFFHEADESSPSFIASCNSLSSDAHPYSPTNAAAAEGDDGHFHSLREGYCDLHIRFLCSLHVDRFSWKHPFMTSSRLCMLYNMFLCQ